MPIFMFAKQGDVSHYTSPPRRRLYQRIRTSVITVVTDGNYGINGLHFFFKIFCEI